MRYGGKDGMRNRWLLSYFIPGAFVEEVQNHFRTSTKKEVAGFEPARGGFADLCLTTWLHLPEKP